MNHFYTLAGLGALGAASGGAYLIHNSLSETSAPTLKDKLVKERYIVMGSSDSNWNTVLTKHKDSSIHSGKKFTGNITTVDDLKKKCEKSLSSSDSSLYDAVKLWCTVPKTVQDRLKDLGVELLSMTDEASNAQEQWTKLKDKYKAIKSGEGIKEFTVSEPEGEDAWKKLRDECKKYIAKDKWDSEYDYYLDKLTTWCSQKSPFLNGN
ncbi:hypothetical protein HF1_03300 [Mycoplasma haemofelis str. Langford 1]|uniref:Uncharacterized protein n=1 Tax=Mycoplasma haemofelis (strain Langford 1) TaxID=941640 RepID=E8ZGR7_MYCHL|nr:hypothetical protein [Mycoplasma haemofelis]CBY92338.1 hypothetical protein HF1_03300 [Mycoplasma haemofelis str. Langford 1]